MYTPGPIGRWSNKDTNHHVRFPVTTAEENARFDRNAESVFHLLSEEAGLGVVQAAGEMRGRTAIVCGTGNNGADGLVVARKLSSLHQRVDVFIVSSRQQPFSFRSDKRDLQAEYLARCPVPIFEVGQCPPDSECLISTPVKYNEHTFVTMGPGEPFRDLRGYALVVDAILGTGTKPPGDNAWVYQRLFDLINASGAKVISVDIPSGVNPDTGALLYARPVKAHTTVTFGSIKPALVFHPGTRLAGSVVVSSLSFSDILYDSTSMWLITPPILAARDPQASKSMFGRAVFISGSTGSYYGAPMLSSYSFLKAGGGYSKLVTSESVAAVVAAVAPEVVMLTSEPHPEWSSIVDCHVVVIGPGLGLSEASVEKFNWLMNGLLDSPGKVKTLIIDGDGITIFANHFDMSSLIPFQAKGISVVLTPHRGEWKTLFGADTATPEMTEYEYITKTRQILGTVFPDTNNVTVVVKGARTGVVSKFHKYVNVTGNSGMATSGSGDVLCGVLAAMFARHQSGFADPPADPIACACAAVFLHGLAGDIAAESIGEDGVVASDIMHYVPEALKRARDKAGFAKYFPTII